MLIAQLTAMRSHCLRMQVGCVITDTKHENIVIGYNGGYRGGPNGCLGDPDVAGACGCIHAEANALVKAWQGDKIAYITHTPCLVCATMLINANVREVYYVIDYHKTDGIDLLNHVGIPCMNIGAAVMADHQNRDFATLNKLADLLDIELTQIENILATHKGPVDD